MFRKSDAKKMKSIEFDGLKPEHKHKTQDSHSFCFSLRLIVFLLSTKQRYAYPRCVSHEI